MKKPLLCVWLSLSLSVCSYAKIWRLNNNTGITADFTNIQDAHDAASAGDTLHVEGSPESFGSLTSTKKLVIIGPGYFLDQNADLQAHVLPARVDNFTFNEGSAGSEVMGLEIPGSVNINSSDIVIKRNRFGTTGGGFEDWYPGNIYVNNINGTSTPVSNILISQNFAFALNITVPSNGVLVTNNYIASGRAYGDENDQPVLRMHANAVALIKNNIFRRGSFETYNSNVSNNIIYSGTFGGTGNLLSNNIASGDQFGTDNGNKANVDMTAVFVGTGSSDAAWQLKTTSPAKGAGYGSTTQNPVDCGMYGGQSPYVVSGIPPVPSVYFFVNQPVGSASDPIDVTVKVRSNN